MHQLSRALSPAVSLALLALAGCNAEMAGEKHPSGSGAAPATGGAGPGTGGAGPASGGTGNTPATGGAGGSVAGTGNTGTGGTLGGTGGTGGTTIPALCADQNTIQPGRAPLRRLTIYEYNQTVRALLGDDTNPASALPSEDVGNGFGNDADRQFTPPLLVEGYVGVAEAIAARATATPAALSALNACAAGVTTDTEAACGRTIIESFVPRAYRRPLVAGEADEYATLFETVRADNGFASAVGAVIEAVLQSPHFLYRVEFGVPETANPALKRPTGPEMATRLSYFLWGSPPDAALDAAAATGELLTNAGVRAQAERMLADPRARTIVNYFFDNLFLLSNSSVAGVTRDPAMFPNFTASIGNLMREETRTFIEYEVFDPAATGTLVGILTAPYTFANQTLASYYGIQGVTGDAFQRVNLDVTQRLGLLTHGSVMIASTPTNFTNPVRRGALIVNHLMCRGIELPPPEVLATATPPDPYSAPTGRERYSIHSQNPVCAGCHSQMDPMGFALEQFDAVGQFRTMENNVTINPTGEVPDMVNGSVSGPVELAVKLSQNEEVQNCFASKWLDFAYGQELHSDSQADQCTREQLAAAFRASNFNVKQLLLELTQTDGFLFLGLQE